MTTNSGMPAYLAGDQHKPTQRIRCPIHGFIKYSEAERRIVDHPAFQRLRHIKQLSFTYYLYPGATHTRFEHSFGVLELVSRVLDALCLKRGKDLEDELRHVVELKVDTLARARQLLRLLALFHDMGHTPFSHSGELGGVSHEALSLQIVKARFERKLDQWFFKGCGKLVCHVMQEDVSSVPQRLLIVHNIIKGQVDMDRTDYLARDSHHCGVEYGVFDHARLIDSLDLARDHQGNLVLCVDQGGFHVVEALLLARYQISLQVYYHRVRRIYDIYLAKFLEGWIHKVKEVTLAQFQQSDDSEVFEAIRHHARQKGSPVRRWAQSLTERVHHRMVFLKGDHADANDEEKVDRLLGRARGRYRGWDFILDKARGSVHRLWVRGERHKMDDFLVRDPRNGSHESIGEKSRIIEKIPKDFFVLRIYALPKTGSIDSATARAKLEKIESWCRSSFGT